MKYMKVVRAKMSKTKHSFIGIYTKQSTYKGPESPVFAFTGAGLSPETRLWELQGFSKSLPLRIH